MRLQRLTLKNFRQFKDESIEFSLDDKQNVTVIHGRNGSGKTTLLNAFTWVLYGKIDFETGDDRLANEGAMATAAVNDTVRVEATLEFDDGGTNYQAHRWCDFQKQTEDDLSGEEIDNGLELKYDDETGAMSERDNPSVALERILPPRLSELFFFDGEDIDELAGIDNQDQIQDAIQNIMGLTILERSINHLQDVESYFEDEMKEFGSTELSNLITEKRQLQQDIADLEQQKGDKEGTREQLLEDVKQIEQKLTWFDDAAALQQERQRKEQNRHQLEENIKNVTDDICSEISSSGYLTFAMPAIQETAKDLDDLRAQGKIPSELNNTFVNDLLEKGECICGQPLEEHSKAYQAVANYRNDAVHEGVDQAAIRIISHLEHISDERSEFFTDIEELVDQRKDLNDQVSKLSERIDEIGNELENIDTPEGQDVEDPAELEKTRKKKQQEREELLKEISKIEERIDNKKEELSSLKEEIEEAREEETKAKRARLRMLAAEQARENFQDHFTSLQDTVRDWCDTLINQTFDNIAQKDLKAGITDEFKLRITQEVGNGSVEVDKSTGERQIASLAFIGSLVSIAKQRYESDSETPYFTGGIYPIVMDSPFGALDNEHRRQVSRSMPDLGEQIVVLVTDSQWKGPVANEMQDIAGEQYRLEFSDGTAEGEYPRTEIVPEATATMEEK